MVLLLLLLLGGCATLSREAGPERIAFGSCMKPDRPQPVWEAIIDSQPDLFLFIGDNIYADTLEPEVMRERYRELAAQRSDDGGGAGVAAQAQPAGSD